MCTYVTHVCGEENIINVGICLVLSVGNVCIQLYVHTYACVRMINDSLLNLSLLLMFSSFSSILLLFIVVGGVFVVVVAVWIDAHRQVLMCSCVIQRDVCLASKCKMCTVCMRMKICCHVYSPVSMYNSISITVECRLTTYPLNAIF